MREQMCRVVVVAREFHITHTRYSRTCYLRTFSKLTSLTHTAKIFTLTEMLSFVCVFKTITPPKFNRNQSLSVTWIHICYVQWMRARVCLMRWKCIITIHRILKAIALIGGAANNEAGRRYAALALIYAYMLHAMKCIKHVICLTPWKQFVKQTF